MQYRVKNYNNESSDICIKIPFSHISLSEKLEVKKLGVRQTKNIEITQAGAKSRKFSLFWLTKTAWLTTCEERKSLYCFNCLLFGGESVWSKAGYSDLKNTCQKN